MTPLVLLDGGEIRLIVGVGVVNCMGHFLRSTGRFAAYSPEELANEAFEDAVDAAILQGKVVMLCERRHERTIPYSTDERPE